MARRAVKKGLKGIANLEEMRLPGPGPHNSRTEKHSPPALGFTFHLEWERQKGCGRQDPAQTGRRLEHPLRALRSGHNSRGSLV